MKTYYIYHIPGIKIGCTEMQPKFRVNAQGYSEFEILEQYTDIYIASDREIELQKQYGYKVDTTPYYITSIKNKDLMQRNKTSNAMINNSNRIGKLHTNESKALMKNSAINRNNNPKRTETAKSNLAFGQINSEISATKQRKACVKCGRYITLINYNKHYNACLKRETLS